MAVDEFIIKWSMDSKNFNDGLTSMDRSMKVLKSEFGVTSNKLKEFGSQTDQLKNKQDYLTKAMEIQKAKVDTLKKAYDNQVQATGENSKEAENLAIKLNNQIKYYNSLEKELQQTNSELDKQSGIWNKVSKNLDNVSGKMKNFGSKLSDIGGSLTTKITAPLTVAFGLLTKGTEELRMDLSKLEANINSAGASIEKTNSQFKYLSAITGEADSSIEALSNLLSAGLTETQMQQAIDNLSGAIIKFPDTLKIESLADSLQETLATGQATGQYGELLERLGVNLEDFNAGLEVATANGTAHQYTLDILAKNGMANLNEEYKKNNEETIRNAEAQQELQMKFADLGEKLTPLLTKLTDFGIKIMDSFANLDEGTQNGIISFGIFAAAAGPVISTVGNLSNGLSKTMDFASKAGNMFNTLKNSTIATSIATKIMSAAQGALNFVMGLNPIFLVIAGLVALGATFTILYNKCEWFRNGVDFVWGKITETFTNFDNFLKGIFAIDWTNSFGALGNIFNAFFVNISNYWEAIKQIFGGIIDFVVGVFTGDWARAWDGVKNIFGGIMNGLGAVIKAPLNAVIGLINMAIDGLNSISFTAPDWVPFVGGKHFGVNLPKINYLYEGGIINSPTFLNPNTVVGDSYKGIGRQPEAVIPLGQMYSKIRNIVREESGQGETIIYTTNVFNVDGKELERQTTREVIKSINRTTNSYRKSKGGLGIA